MKIHMMEQGSPEWIAIRRLKFTGSEAQAIANNGKGLESLVIRLMAEYLSSSQEEPYSNDNMARGNDLEDVARQLYSLERGVNVQQVGFVEMNKYVGASPDGLLGEDGCLEIKCHNDVGHYRIMAGGLKEVNSAYLWQVQMELLVTKRKFCDLICYNPNFKKSMLIFRIEPDEEKQKALQVGLEKGVELLKKHLLLNK